MSLFTFWHSSEQWQSGRERKNRQKPPSTQYSIEYSSLTCYVQLCLCVFIYHNHDNYYYLEQHSANGSRSPLIIYSQKLNIAAYCLFKLNECIVIRYLQVKYFVRVIQMKRKQKLPFLQQQQKSRTSLNKPNMNWVASTSSFSTYGQRKSPTNFS